MVTIADYFDQMVDMNDWRDHHQIESPDVLYPEMENLHLDTTGYLQLPKTIASNLDVVPPIFDHCTKLIAYKDELKARHLYRNVVVRVSSLR